MSTKKKLQCCWEDSAKNLALEPEHSKLNTTQKLHLRNKTKPYSLINLVLPSLQNSLKYSSPDIHNAE